MAEWELLSTLQAEAWNQLGEGMIITDPQGVIRFVNRAASEMHGVTELGVETEGYSEVYNLLRTDGSQYPSCELPLARAVRDGEVVENEMWLIDRPDGTRVYAEGSARRVHDEQGKVLGAVLTLRDRTIRENDIMQLRQSLETQRMLLDEVNHRVANNLGLLISLVRYQRRQTTSDEALAVLDKVQVRLQVMASIHSALYRSDEAASVDVGSYFVQMMQDVAQALGGETPVSVECMAPEEMALPVNQVIPLALAINELMTNSLKYAFIGRDSGEISLLIERVDTKRILTYRDNGVGLPAGFDLDAAGGLGMTIIQTLARQLAAEIKIVRDAPGTCFVIAF
ncbi:sensor histidine kinase [Pontivivens nitratireducens]|uniref:histidine kinase n=1 Tax=Pontivivens nitratireducens TaxID=2758038 RepID=A0A6G7VM10_9RHOB|nr:histidine kinase dimerization/phosphoacceptor domain -containing protein [Pontibrevibacter nitratireducens]QIK41133.1 PAS domain-containing protein [Pontibrevibacter nitratireducens]